MDDFELEKKNDIEFSDTSTKQDEFENLDIQVDSKLNNNNNRIINIKTPNSNKKGKVFSFLFFNGEPLIVIGPHCNYKIILGPLFLCFSTFTTIIAVLFFYFVSDKLNNFVKIFGEINYFVFILSYFYTAMSNPGIPKNDLWISNVTLNTAFQKYNIKNYRICPICQVIMNIEENTSHCDDCDICVEG